MKTRPQGHWNKPRYFPPTRKEIKNYVGREKYVIWWSNNALIWCFCWHIHSVKLQRAKKQWHNQQLSILGAAIGSFRDRCRSSLPHQWIRPSCIEYSGKTQKVPPHPSFNILGPSLESLNMPPGEKLSTKFTDQWVNLELVYLCHTKHHWQLYGFKTNMKKRKLCPEQLW